LWGKNGNVLKNSFLKWHKFWGAFDSVKNHKRQRRKRQSVTAKREKCDFSRLAVTDWRLRRWRLWFLALMTATLNFCVFFSFSFAEKIQRIL